MVAGFKRQAKEEKLVMNKSLGRSEDSRRCQVR